MWNENFKFDPIGWYGKNDVNDHRIVVHKKVSQDKKKSMTPVYPVAPEKIEWISFPQLHAIERMVYGDTGDTTRHKFAVEVIKEFCKHNGMKI